MQEITHQELKDAYRTGRWITAGAFYFESAASIRALLREHGYAPARTAVRIERCPNADAGYSVAIAQGEDLDTFVRGPVLVLGFAIMSELGALVEREDDTYCQQTLEATPAAHGDLLNHNGTGTGWCICGERTWKFWMDAGVYHTTCMAGGHWTKKAGA